MRYYSCDPENGQWYEVEVTSLDHKIRIEHISPNDPNYRHVWIDDVSILEDEEEFKKIT